ncbi:hypothetical protein ACVXHB_30115 [Escherichia coli]
MAGRSVYPTPESNKPTLVSAWAQYVLGGLCDHEEAVPRWKKSRLR